MVELGAGVGAVGVALQVRGRSTFAWSVTDYASYEVQLKSSLMDATPDVGHTGPYGPSRHAPLPVGGAEIAPHVGFALIQFER